jgi:hypothetical protein
LFIFQFHEVLEIQTGHMALHITLTGKGVSPMIEINMPMQDGVLDMGAVLAGEYLERTFKVRAVFYLLKYMDTDFITVEYQYANELDTVQNSICLMND